MQLCSYTYNVIPETVVEMTPLGESLLTKPEGRQQNKSQEIGRSLLNGPSTVRKRMPWKTRAGSQKGRQGPWGQALGLRMQEGPKACSCWWGGPSAPHRPPRPISAPTSLPVALAMAPAPGICRVK